MDIKTIIVSLFLSTILITIYSEKSFEYNGEAEQINTMQECKKNQGKKLLQCMHKLKLNEQKTLLRELSSNQKQDYFSELTLQEYEIFLDNYNEYEWARLFQSLTAEEKKFWPKNVQAQRIAIANFTEHALYGSSRYQTLSSLIDLFPFGKNAREGIEKLASDKAPLQVKIQKRFKEYIEKSFRVNGQ